MNTSHKHKTPHAETYSEPVGENKKTHKKNIFFFIMFFILLATNVENDTFSPMSHPDRIENPALSNVFNSTTNSEELLTSEATNTLAINIPLEKTIITDKQKQATPPVLEKPITEIPLLEKEQPLFLATISSAFNIITDFDFFPSAPEAMPDTAFFSEDIENTEDIDAYSTSKLPIYEKDPRYTVALQENGDQLLHSTIKSGDIIGNILNSWLSPQEINDLLAVAKPITSLRNIHIGRPYSILLSADDTFLRFEYEKDETGILSVSASSKPDTSNLSFAAQLIPIEYDIILASVHESITSSLFEAVAATGEGATLANELAEVFSYQIDFIRDLQQGDSFEALIEKKYRDGKFKGYGKMIAATFTNNNKKYTAYLHTGANNKSRYYNEKGESLQRLLLKAPLDFSRVSSGYSMARKHPVFGNTRPHQGIDYAAPHGTPVRAVGDGVVTFAGWQNGYGKTVIVKHASGIESQYAHLSGFAKNLKKGSEVAQGKTIAYVGATGVATGPHLDFRIKQNGKFINPDKVIIPPSAPLTPNEKESYLAHVAEANAYFSGEKSLTAYQSK